MGCCKEKDPAKAAVWHALNYYAFEDASFLAERLFLENKGCETLYLLATCYYRQGRVAEAYDLLKKSHSTTPKCRLLFAQCCLKLNRLSEGEQIIVNTSTDGSLAAIENSITAEFQEISGICLSTLATIYRRCHRLEHAVYFYRASLKRNPYLWSSYANLCQAGEKDSPDDYFKTTNCPSFVPQTSSPGALSDVTNDMNLVNPGEKIYQTYTPKCTFGQVLAHSTPISSNNNNQISSSVHCTPDQIRDHISSHRDRVVEDDNPCTTPGSALRKQGDPFSSNKVRRSSRLMTSGRNMKSKENDRKAGNKAQRTGPSIIGDAFKKSSTKDKSVLSKRNPNMIISSIMSLFAQLGHAYQSLCQYECKKALQLFNKLPKNHYSSGWVLSQCARALYEMTEYTQAARIYQSVHQNESSRCSDLTFYGTCLWYTQREVELSALANEMLEANKNSPETWCAVGNCFSLQKEHETAIKFFERSVLVDPEFAYGYTLLGHEYSFIDELDDAMNCYRHAVRIDPRHYNAWYGIGQIYFKQEKHELALCHFRKAQSINQSNAAIMAHIAVVLNAMKKHKEALKVLTKALEQHPKHPLCKFHKASTLLCLEKCDSALGELDELEAITPTESLIYFLKAKIHRKMGNSHLAMMHFSWAMDLDPQGSNNHIKEAIDKHYQPDDLSAENT